MKNKKSPEKVIKKPKGKVNMNSIMYLSDLIRTNAWMIRVEIKAKLKADQQWDKLAQA